MSVRRYNEMQRWGYKGPLDKYFTTKTLQRLKGKGMFCGMDYMSLEKIKPKEYYSRLDHSKNVAYTAWIILEDLKVALAGAFHDVGTLSFAHANSFKKGQALTQDNDELSVKSVLLQDERLLAYLQEDGINIDDVVDYSNYPLLDKDIPALCLDRADGILATCLFWAKTHSFRKIRSLYNMLGYFEDWYQIDTRTIDYRIPDLRGEVTLNENYESAYYEDFFAAINTYSKILLSKESRFIMEILGMTLNYYEELGVFNEQDLFNLSERQIIEKIMASEDSSVWQEISRISEVYYARPNGAGLHIYSQPKIREANPLVWGQMQVVEIGDLSGDFYRELNDLQDAVDLTFYPLVARLSDSTEKKLAKYIKERTF